MLLHMLLLLSLSWPSHATSTWAISTTWNAISQAIISLSQQIGSEVLAEYLANQLQPQTIDKLQQEIAALRAQLHEQKDKAPRAEIAMVSKLLIHTKELLQTLSQQVTVDNNTLAATKQHLNEDIRILQNELVQIRKQLRLMGIKPRRTVAITHYTPTRIQLNYTYRPQQGHGNPQPLTQDRVLKTGDHYKITFTPEHKVWVYIFQTDSSGQIFQLFPIHEMNGVVVNQTNPVVAGDTRNIPSARQSFYLNDQTGTETIYFIVSAKQDQDLETRTAAYMQARTTPATIPQLTATQQALEQEMVVGRGPGGISEDLAMPKQTIPGDDGQTFQLNAAYLDGLCSQAKGCINVLRFYHE